jgi:hypothetical protein
MKHSVGGGLLVALLCGSTVRAELLPTFHAGSCAYQATHIVVVKTEVAAKGEFVVVESWKGDLKKGSYLKIAALAKEAKGEMVLFLRRDPKRPADDPWQKASFFDWQTSVVWLNGDKVTAVDQPRNPGPAFVTTLPFMETRKAFKDLVFFYLRTERAFAEVRSLRDLDKRVEALANIVNGHFDRKEQAFAELAKCGPKAVPSLRKFLEQPANHQQQYAVAALADAGGKDVVPELNKMLEGELAYWKKIGPTLEPGWWLNTDVEPWKRFSKLSALVAVYRKYPTPALRTNIIAVRDFFRTLDAVDGDRRIGNISNFCDDVLKGKDK